MYKASTKLMSMSEEVWWRHANPWSGWTRVATVPFLVVAFWSRDWLGIYFLIPVAVILLWAWLNPRVFPKPVSTDHWMSKGVFGEKIFTSRKKGKTEVPQRHVIAANLTTAISIIGVLILVYGLYALEVWPTLLGTALAVLGKMWFVDRMVWLYEDMCGIDEGYRQWVK